MGPAGTFWKESGKDMGGEMPRSPCGAILRGRAGASHGARSTPAYRCLSRKVEFPPLAPCAVYWQDPLWPRWGPAILGSCCGLSWGSEPLLVRASSVSGAVCAVALLVSRGDLTDSACPRGPISQAHLPLQGDTVACKQQCSQGLGRASHLGGTEEREEVVP